MAIAHAFRDVPAPTSPSDIPITSRDVQSLVATAEAGDEAAIRRLGEALAALDLAQARLAMSRMLRSERPEVRAAGTAWVGRRGAAGDVALLVPRMSDADWRVRAAAFDAVQRVAGRLPGAPAPSPAPLRDTPVPQREGVIFQWINAWRNAGDELPPLPRLCDLYAPANDWLSGRALAESCLACHAPPDAYSAADVQSCASCHARAHESWARSAHARGVTHLGLRSVDERTKQVKGYDYGGREGLLCTTCHAPARAAASSAPLPAGTEDLRPPHRFVAGAAASCTTCHDDTSREWEAWRSNPRPLPSPWLPGEVTWDERPEARTCMSCHMGQQHVDRPGLDHAFAARRDETFMRQGLVAHVEPPTASRGAQLVLTNLAGHAYPSGTVRRALRVEVVFDEDEKTRRVLTRLSSATVPTTQPRDGALRPGEQRRIDLPRPAGASRVTCDIVYERNQFQSGAYELRLHRLNQTLIPPPPIEADR